ncbi:MAG: efflux RND transporter periplasmic adaptor subunit [Bacteroidetes bacterium]|nr:efflux RND transporter periplasmic adaptor subunit [Bacteroidota bacterium]
MKSSNIFFSTLVVLLAACGGKQDPVQAKKAELEKIRKEIAALQAKAKTLEDELAKMQPGGPEGKLVETETVETADFRSYLTLEGKADAEQSTIATAQVPGTVTQVLAQAGQQVSAGQALAYLDNAALKQSRQQLEQQLSFVNTLYDKQKRLWEQGVGTEVQFLSAKNQKEALEKNLATLDAQIAMYTVKSPISGSVESVDTKVGQAAAPGIPMFKVVNLGNLKVVADVAESYAQKINTGDQVLIEFPDLEKKLEAKVSFASKVIDPLNRTFKVEIRIPAMADVKPNMIARLKITNYQNKAAITVPSNCLQQSDEATYVMVAIDEKGKLIARRRVVKTGKSGEDRTEITDGLQKGDLVIVTGYQELNDGQEIQPAKTEK